MIVPVCAKNTVSTLLIYMNINNLTPAKTLLYIRYTESIKMLFVYRYSLTL